jgi:hypothetical protein
MMGKPITLFVALVLGVATGVLGHLVGFGVVEGGKEMLWGHGFEQAHLSFFHWLWPAVVGVFICTFLAMLLRVRFGGGLTWIALVVAASELVIFVIPVVAVWIGHSDGLCGTYALALMGVSLPWWSAVLSRRLLKQFASQRVNQLTSQPIH